MDDAFFLFPSGDKTKRRDDGTDELSCRSKSFSVRNTRPEKAGREGRWRTERRPHCGAYRVSHGTGTSCIHAAVWSGGKRRAPWSKGRKRFSFLHSYISDSYRIPISSSLFFFSFLSPCTLNRAISTLPFFNQNFSNKKISSVVSVDVVES